MKSLGVMAEWSNPYLTVQTEAYKGTLNALYELVKKGLLYSAERPVLWSVAEETALADAEVEYKNGRFQSLMVKFPVVSYNQDSFSTSQNLNGASVVCWTSTPWSLPGNRMVAYHNDTNYCVLVVKKVTDDSLLSVGNKFVVMEKSVEDFASKAKVEDYELVEFFTGNVFENIVLKNPLYDNEVKMYHASFVREDSGTGFVHVAPSLGPDDFYLAKQHNVEVDKTLNGDGTYHETVPLFAGQHVLNADGSWGEAQGNVLLRLKENNMVVALWNDKHSTAYSWRSGVPLLYRSTTQWFVKVKGELLNDSLEVLNDVSFLPETSENRLRSMMKDRPDWCVSRQRSWGVPMALFTDKEGNLLVDEDVMNTTLELFGKHGGDCWYSMDKKEFLGDKYNPDDYEKLFDVLDVWFESGATWSWVMNGVKQADLYLEGSDQHRGWFQSSLLESVALQGKSPYKTLFTHGFVLDAKGKKMAKSLGNVVDPMDVVNKYGADVLRWWVACSDVSHDVQYSEKSMVTYESTVKKFRNTLRWLLGVVSNDENHKLTYGELETYDKLMLSNLYRKNLQVWNAYKNYDMLTVTKLVRDFCLEDLSAVWMNMKKDTFYCDSLTSQNRKSAVYTANCLFKVFSSWLAPMLPFCVEQSWNFYPHKENMSFAGLLKNTLPEDWNHDNEEEWKKLLELRNLVLSEAEKKQKSGEIKNLNHMEANVSTLLRFNENYDFALLTGLAKVNVDYSKENKVTIFKTHGDECPRCRKMTHLEDSGVCLRCENV
jgi:isoleucyl-tRNA synthetase